MASRRPRASGPCAARSSHATRNNPDRFIVLAFFDSYESAMENSNLPETQELSARFGEFTDGPVIFQDFDIIEDNS